MRKNPRIFALAGIVAGLFGAVFATWYFSGSLRAPGASPAESGMLPAVPFGEGSGSAAVQKKNVVRQPANLPPVASDIAAQVSKWKLDMALGGEYPKTISGIDQSFPLAKHNLWGASQEFLDKYGAHLFKIDASQLRISDIKPGVSTATDGFKKIVYEQQIDGVPVLNSRVAFFYINEDTLFQVQANLVSGSKNAPTQPAISAEESAAIAYNTISIYYAREGISVPDSLSVESLAARGKYAIFLAETGDVSGVYQYVLRLDGLSGSNAGVHEIIVDANLHQVTADRKISRN